MRLSHSSKERETGKRTNVLLYFSRRDMDGDIILDRRFKKKILRKSEITYSDTI